MLGTLYLIPNTLGQAENAPSDSLTYVIPPHVLTTTASLDYFVAENAKSTRAFLKLVSASFPLTKTLQEIQIAELNVNTPSSALPSLLAPLLDGKDAGLVSEAGVPAVADPGANLVRMAHTKGIVVKPLVGPSSILLAIMAGGLNGQSFAFNGYLPTDSSQRIKRIKELENRSQKEKQTQSFIETPYRNGTLLEALASTCQPNTLISIATDLTLASESIKTKSAAQWKADLGSGKTPNFHKKPTVFSLLSE
jgi:16S rRNA (cytidine1402-2'-O)-methyltransferase